MSENTLGAVAVVATACNWTSKALMAYRAEVVGGDDDVVTRELDAIHTRLMVLIKAVQLAQVAE